MYKESIDQLIAATAPPRLNFQVWYSKSVTLSGKRWTFTPLASTERDFAPTGDDFLEIKYSIKSHDHTFSWRVAITTTIIGNFLNMNTRMNVVATYSRADYTCSKITARVRIHLHPWLWCTRENCATILVLFVSWVVYIFGWSLSTSQIFISFLKASLILVCFMLQIKN